MIRTLPVEKMALLCLLCCVFTFPVFADSSLHNFPFDENPSFIIKSAFKVPDSLIIEVVDAEDKLPIPGVAILNNQQALVAYTDVDGLAQVDALKAEQVFFLQFFGYATRKITLRADQDEKVFRVMMHPLKTQLDSIVIVGRRNLSSDEQAFELNHVSYKEISLAQPPTPLEALELNGELYVQRSQMGGGSPIVRGFEANKLLLVVDGVRMNNAIYRNGHLHNAITVDEAILEQVEVIHGPGSIIYGSDALGGVIHFRTRELKLPGKRGEGEFHFKPAASLRYASANGEKTIHWNFEYGNKHWAALSSFTFSDFGHLRSGANRPDAYPDFGKRLFYATRQGREDVMLRNDNENLQIGTAYRQWDFLQKWLLQISKDIQVTFNVQMSTSSDVPRYDQLAAFRSDDTLKFAEWYYGPQFRFLSSMRLEHTQESSLYDKLTLITAYQNIREDRISRRFGNPLRIFNGENVDVYSATLDFEKRVGEGKKHLLQYGLEGNYNSVSSVAYNRNISSGELSSSEPTRYPSGGSSMSFGGAYLFYQYKVPEAGLRFHAGVRFTQTYLNAAFDITDPIEWPESYYDGVNSYNSAFTWALGGNWRAPEKGWGVRALIATAFRAANIDDFGKVRPNSGNVLVPNADLVPEEALTAEITLSKRIKLPGISEDRVVSLNGTFFYTWLTDAVLRKNGSLLGDTLLRMGGELLRIQKNVNAGKAFIWGWSANADAQLLPFFALEGRLSYTKGRERTDELLLPLAHIPPLYGQFGLRLSNERLTARAFFLFNSAKPLSEYALNSSDNEEEATPDGTPAWQTINFQFSYALQSQWRINLALENITDLHYRPFSSGVSAPGRNLKVSLVYGLF